MNIGCASGAGGRVVATGAAKPNTDFYVESPSVRELAEDIAGAKTVVLYQSPQQTGKTTDALAMCRLLRRHNYEVRQNVAVATLPLPFLCGSAPC